ncbi:hypothetical protein FGO68_gene15489 [Halteria grandinella]|uniref:Uncharacterized protein n=1 Tax=Halteria grandinella TaxID=5974 RepID=A0A8J8NW46_HALGN|nr:hypothetical protein FGO68_gene15489 [Halteria grandinella]
MIAQVGGQKLALRPVKRKIISAAEAAFQAAREFERVKKEQEEKANRGYGKYKFDKYNKTGGQRPLEYLIKASKIKILGVEKNLLQVTRLDREAQLKVLRFPEMGVQYVPPDPNKKKKRMPYIVTLPVKGDNQQKQQRGQDPEANANVRGGPYEALGLSSQKNARLNMRNGLQSAQPETVKGQLVPYTEQSNLHPHGSSPMDDRVEEKKARDKSQRSKSRQNNALKSKKKEVVDDLSDLGLDSMSNSSISDSESEDFSSKHDLATSQNNLLVLQEKKQIKGVEDALPILPQQAVSSPQHNLQEETQKDECKFPILLGNLHSTKKIQFMLGVSPKFQPEGDSLGNSNEEALSSVRYIKNDPDNPQTFPIPKKVPSRGPQRRGHQVQNANVGFLGDIVKDFKEPAPEESKQKPLNHTRLLHICRMSEAINNIKGESKWKADNLNHNSAQPENNNLHFDEAKKLERPSIKQVIVELPCQAQAVPLSIEDSELQKGDELIFSGNSCRQILPQRLPGARGEDCGLLDSGMSSLNNQRLDFEEFGDNESSPKILIKHVKAKNQIKPRRKDVSNYLKPIEEVEIQEAISYSVLQESVPINIPDENLEEDISIVYPHRLTPIGGHQRMNKDENILGINVVRAGGQGFGLSEIRAGGIGGPLQQNFFGASVIGSVAPGGYIKAQTEVNATIPQQQQY